MPRRTARGAHETPAGRGDGVRACRPEADSPRADLASAPVTSKLSRGMTWSRQPCGRRCGGRPASCLGTSRATAGWTRLPGRRSWTPRRGLGGRVRGRRRGSSTSRASRPGCPWRSRHGRLWTPRAAHRARPRPHGLDRGRGSVARGRGRRQRADRRLAPRQPGRARRRSRPGLGPGPRGGARLPPRGSSSSGASSGGSSATCRPGSPAPAPSRRPSACPTARRCSRR